MRGEGGRPDALGLPVEFRVTGTRQNPTGPDPTQPPLLNLKSGPNPNLKLLESITVDGDCGFTELLHTTLNF